MPAIAYEFDTLAGPVSQGGSTGDVYATVSGISVTLAAGRWLVRARASHTNLTGSGSVTRSSSVEVRHNTTRYGVSRWCSLFGSFAPSVAAGSMLQTFFVIDASNGDTIDMRLRRVNDDGTDDGDVEIGDAIIEAINLDDLVEGTDYWYADGGNSDTAEVTAGDATWITAAAAGRIGQDASEVDLTAPSTGDYWVIASIETFNNGTPGTVEDGRARLRVDGAAAGTGQEHTHTRDVGSPDAYSATIHEEDVLALTANDQPEIQWEVANDASGDSAGYRRSRIFVLRLGALADYAFIANAGNIQVSSTGTVEGTNGLTFNFGTADVLISGTASWQTGGGDWGRAWLHQDAGDIHHPPTGRMHAVVDEGVGAADDELPIAFGTIVSSTGSETWRLAQQTDASANAYTLGRARGNGASARTILIALQLETATSTEFAEAIGSVAISGTAVATPESSASATGAVGLGGSAAATVGTVFAAAEGFIGLSGRLTMPSEDTDSMSIRALDPAGLSPLELDPFGLEITQL